jgi:hypothetical protein
MMSLMGLTHGREAREGAARRGDSDLRRASALWSTTRRRTSMPKLARKRRNRAGAGRAWKLARGGAAGSAKRGRHVREDEGN